MGGAAAGFAGVKNQVFAPLISEGCAIGGVQGCFGSVGMAPTGVKLATDGAVAGDHIFRLFQNFECYGAAVAASFYHVAP